MLQVISSISSTSQFERNEWVETLSKESGMNHRKEVTMIPLSLTRSGWYGLASASSKRATRARKLAREQQATQLLASSYQHGKVNRQARVHGNGTRSTMSEKHKKNKGWVRPHQHSLHVSRVCLDLECDRMLTCVDIMFEMSECIWEWMRQMDERCTTKVVRRMKTWFVHKALILFYSTERFQPAYHDNAVQSWSR